MPNIYLRLPSYVSAFYRNRDINNPLPYDKPVTFVEYSQEYVIMSIGLRILNDKAMARSHCYSQFAWKNMLQGRAPGGGLKIIRRDKTEWLSPTEVRTLADEKVPSVDENFDYLCIGTPREICVGGELHRITGSYSLDGRSAQALEALMRHEFQFCLLDWLQQDRKFCVNKGIERTRIESLERFLMVYDIPVSTDNKERESLRRMVNRWLNNAKALLIDRQRFDDTFFEHLTDDEVNQIMRNAKDRKKAG